RRRPRSPLFPYTTLFRSHLVVVNKDASTVGLHDLSAPEPAAVVLPTGSGPHEVAASGDGRWAVVTDYGPQGPGGTTLTVVDVPRSEEHTSELQSRENLVC